MKFRVLFPAVLIDFPNSKVFQIGEWSIKSALTIPRTEKQTSDPPLGYQSFSNLDYTGTLYVDTEEDNDFIGIVFGYQSSSKFYTVMWKKSGQVYWDRVPFVATSATGLTIKV